MEKLQEYFHGMLVKKNCKNDQFSILGIPSFIRDWFIRKYADKNGDIDSDFVASKIRDILPRKENVNVILNKLFCGEQVKFLAKIEIDIDLKKNIISFAIPDLGIENKETYISSEVWEDCKDYILSANGAVWGILTLAMQKVMIGKKEENKISLRSFVNFMPYTIDLEFFKKARKAFDFEEWVDVVLGAIDYNPQAFKNIDEKLALLTRLLPFVEKRLNMIELAPKGTGKSYLFSQISKFGWLSNGGVMTRAKLFYDMQTKTDGLVSCKDYVALDEVSSIRFTDINEMRGAMKGYLESGTYSVGNKMGNGDAGLILLGNIHQDDMNIEKDMFSTLPDVFHESALLDRFHGFIEGWKIPRMSENKKANDWAINCEYYSSIMHELREDITYRALVDEILVVPSDADTRDVTAIKRITTAFVKLLFPHWQKESDVEKEYFEKYCLNPAVHMRYIIKTQMAIMDPEYAGKPIAQIAIKE